MFFSEWRAEGRGCSGWQSSQAPCARLDTGLAYRLSLGTGGESPCYPHSPHSKPCPLSLLLINSRETIADAKQSRTSDSSAEGLSTNREEDTICWTEWQHAFPDVNFFMNETVICINPEYFNSATFSVNSVTTFMLWFRPCSVSEAWSSLSFSVLPIDKTCVFFTALPIYVFVQ